MMLTLDTALFIGAFVCFVFAAFGVSGRVNWIGLGLALAVLTALV